MPFYCCLFSLQAGAFPNDRSCPFSFTSRPLGAPKAILVNHDQPQAEILPSKAELALPGVSLSHLPSLQLSWRLDSSVMANCRHRFECWYPGSSTLQSPAKLRNFTQRYFVGFFARVSLPREMLLICHLPLH